MFFLIRPLIEFCISNLTPEVEKVKEELEKNYPFLDVVEYSCLNNCVLCSAKPYALVEGEIVTGNNGEELLSNILKKIEELDL